MLYLIGSYYIIGLIVSMYFIYYYRLCNKTKTEPSKNDAWLALFGVWIWSIQIIVHLFTKKINN